MRNAKSVCRLWFVATLLFLASAHLDAQGISTVEIRNVQLARSLAAVVQDQNGSSLKGVLVEEVTSDWKHSLRSTRTDAEGTFSFAPVEGRKLYYFQLRMDGFNPVRVRLEVDRRHGKQLKLQMEVSD